MDCLDCGAGPLKPDVVFFGENVPPERVARCYALVEASRLLLVLGSSLTVASGFRFVRRAAARGIPVAIVNQGATRGDPLADVLLDAAARPAAAGAGRRGGRPLMHAVRGWMTSSPSTGWPSVEAAELRELQLRRLRWSLRHAYDNVAHYRAAFDAAGVHPDELTSLADLARFPFTSKAELRQNYPFGMFAVPREQVVRVHASSGTTGKPTVVGYTAEDLATWASVMARSIYAAGGRPGDIVHVAYGYGLFTGGLGAHYGAERLGCTVVPISGGMTARQVQLITDFEPRIIMVTPSYFLSILDELAAQGIDAAETSLQIGIFGAEPWTEAMRAEMQQRARLTALDIYGLSEVIGPGIGQEAAGHPGRLQVWEDHFYPEVVDPRDRRGAAGRRAGRAGVHLAHQAGDAGGALPHPRPDPAAARQRLPGLPQHREDHRTHRRHDDHPRRQRLPDPDRGAAAAGAGAGAALRVRADPARPAGRAVRPGGGPGGRRRRRRPGRARSAAWSRTGSGSRSPSRCWRPESIARSQGKAVRVHDRR